MSDASKERRVKLMYVSTELLCEMFKGHRVDENGEIGLIQASGFPEDAEILNMGYNEFYGQFMLKIASATFPSLPEGCEMERLEPTYGVHYGTFVPRPPGPPQRSLQESLNEIKRISDEIGNEQPREKRGYEFL